MKIPKQKKKVTKKQKKTNAVITDEEKRQQTHCAMRQKSDIATKVDLIKSAKFSDFDLELCYQNIPKQLISDVWDEIWPGRPLPNYPKPKGGIMSKLRK